MTHSFFLSAFLFLDGIESLSRRIGLSFLLCGWLSKGLVAVTNEEEGWIQTISYLFLSFKSFLTCSGHRRLRIKDVRISASVLGIIVGVVSGNLQGLEPWIIVT